MVKILDVHIGEVKIARNGEMLKAILGSCVGIGFIWREKKICGLAHCLLPGKSITINKIGARHVDQAFLSLISLMEINKSDFSSVSVIIVGGGNMTNPTALDKSKLIGANNFQSALLLAKKYKLNLVHADGGGDEGRKVFIDGTDFVYRVEKIPRINAI